jgi:hypothetical protein
MLNRVHGAHDSCARESAASTTRRLAVLVTSFETKALENVEEEKEKRLTPPS